MKENPRNALRGFLVVFWGRFWTAAPTELPTESRFPYPDPPPAALRADVKPPASPDLNQTTCSIEVRAGGCEGRDGKRQAEMVGGGLFGLFF